MLDISARGEFLAFTARNSDGTEGIYQARVFGFSDLPDFINVLGPINAAPNGVALVGRPGETVTGVLRRDVAALGDNSAIGTVTTSSNNELLVRTDISSVPPLLDIGIGTPTDLGDAGSGSFGFIRGFDGDTEQIVLQTSIDFFGPDGRSTSEILLAINPDNPDDRRVIADLPRTGNDSFTGGLDSGEIGFSTAGGLTVYGTADFDTATFFLDDGTSSTELIRTGEFLANGIVLENLVLDRNSLVGETIYATAVLRDTASNARSLAVVALPIPEPAAASLLAVAAPLLLRRRR